MGWLMRQYPGTTEASMLRPCGSGTSEHMDGRALDWGLDAADPVQRQTAHDFLARIFAEDEAGNPSALARRMGIMYIIWDDHMYRAYSRPAFTKDPYSATRCKPLRSCSKTTRHRDHMHISLSWSGASAQTTFYRNRQVASVPVLIPRTLQLDPAATAIAKVDVPATGETVTTPFKVTKGVTYRIVGDGLYRYGPGDEISDAACSWAGQAWGPSSTGLLVNDRSPWQAACKGEHTHVAKFTAGATRRLSLRVADDTAADNEGTVSFYVLREDVPLREVADDPPVAAVQPRVAQVAGPAGRRLLRETVALPAGARRGVLTDRALRRGRSYRVVVTGVARSGDTAFDGNCVRYAGRYRPQHTLDLTRPNADHLSLFVAGARVDLHVPGSSRACDANTHRYVGTVKAPVGGRARVRIWDPFDYSDNSGTLTVRLVRLGRR
jgi:hypothetical protein